MYETFDHTADLGLRITARDQESLFAEAGHCLYSVLLANPESVQCVLQREVIIDGDQDDLLLFDWLNELLFVYETQHLVLARFDVSRTDCGVKGVCYGESIDLDRHELDHAIKAITYHELKVVPTEQGWLAEVVVDL